MLRRSIPWLVYLASAVLEAAWATALGLYDGFSKALPAGRGRIAGDGQAAGEVARR